MKGAQSIALMRKTYLILLGGLGNQMFQFASGYALARRWGRELALVDYWFKNTRQRGKGFKNFVRSFELEKFHFIKSNFPQPAHLIQATTYWGARVISQLPWFRHLGLHVDPLIRFNFRRFESHLLDQPKTVLFGYYQSLSYFETYRSELVKFFRISDDEERKIAEFMEERKKKVGPLINVHVRREDSLVHGNNWQGMLSPRYYSSAQRMLTAKTEQLIVFSDDPSWCHQQPEFSNALIVNETDPVKTLRMMSYCDHHVIAGSTLSWWGAWLSECPGKTVIAPLPFFKDKPIEEDKEFFPASWKRLSADYVSV